MGRTVENRKPVQQPVSKLPPAVVDADGRPVDLSKEMALGTGEQVIKKAKNENPAVQDGTSFHFNFDEDEQENTDDLAKKDKSIAPAVMTEEQYESWRHPLANSSKSARDSLHADLMRQDAISAALKKDAQNPAVSSAPGPAVIDPYAVKPAVSAGSRKHVERPIIQNSVQDETASGQTIRMDRSRISEIPAAKAKPAVKQPHAERNAAVRKASSSKKKTTSSVKSRKSPVSKKSYQDRMRIDSRFYRNLLRIFLITLFICSAALVYLYQWLARYERRSISGAMTAYVTSVENHDWDKIYEEDTTYFTELNDKDTVISYLVLVYTGKKASGMTFSFQTGDDTTRYYDVYYQQEKVDTLECTKPEGSDTWKVRSYGKNNSFVFDDIDNASFSINGISINDNYTGENGHIPGAYEDLDLDEELPSVTRYTVGGFINEPVISPSDSDVTAVRDYSANRYYIGKKATAEQEEEFSNEIQETAKAYAEYVTEDGTFYNLTSHLYYGTPFYNAMLGFGNQWYSTHDSHEISNVSVTDILPLGDNAFVGTESLDYTTAAGDNVRTVSYQMQMFFIKDESSGTWKAVNIYLVHSPDDDSSTDAESSPSPSAES